MRKPTVVQLFSILLLLAGGAAVSAQTATESLYKAKCQSCHGATGIADTSAGRANKTPSINSAALKDMSAPEMFASVKGGNGKMHAFKDELTDEQLKDLVAYLRSMRN
jgi:mono/diheme cytochrome c family protein